MSNGPGPYPPHQGHPGYPPPPGQPYPPPGYPPQPGQSYPPPGGWGPPPRKSRVGLYVGIFFGAWFGIGLIVVAVLAMSGYFSRSSSTSSASSQNSYPSSSTSSTSMAGGIDENWLAGRWCSDADSITFSPASRSWSVSSGQYGTYTLTGSLMTMTAPGGETRTATITRLGQDSMQVSAPSQGSETARRC